MKVGDWKNEIDRAIKPGVTHDPAENTVTKNPSEGAQLETQIDSNEDVEDLISIQDTSQDDEDSIIIQDVECSDPMHAVDSELADTDVDGGDDYNMSSGDDVVTV